MQLPWECYREEGGSGGVLLVWILHGDEGNTLAGILCGRSGEVKGSVILPAWGERVRRGEKGRERARKKEEGKGEGL